MEKNIGRNTDKNIVVAEQNSVFKHKLLNICVLAFVGVMTAVLFITFFILIGRNNSESANSIAGTYVLCMLLAAPTLKAFLDRCNCPLMKRLNIIGLVTIFAVILLIVVTIFIAYVA